MGHVYWCTVARRYPWLFSILRQLYILHIPFVITKKLLMLLFNMGKTQPLPPALWGLTDAVYDVYCGVSWASCRPLKGVQHDVMLRQLWVSAKRQDMCSTGCRIPLIGIVESWRFFWATLPFKISCNANFWYYLRNGGGHWFLNPVSIE